MHKQCLLNLAGDHDVNDNEQPTEDIEITVRTDVRHESVSVTQTPPIHGACSDEGIQAGTSTLAIANDSTVQRQPPVTNPGHELLFIHHQRSLTHHIDFHTTQLQITHRLHFPSSTAPTQLFTLITLAPVNHLTITITQSDTLHKLWTFSCSLPSIV